MKSLQGIARIALATTTIGIVTSALVQAQDAPPRGNAANGRRLYLAAGCYTCHGRSGQGGNYNGPAPILAKMEIPFEGFESLLRNPANDMPAFSEALLSHQDVADIYAFVESLPVPRPAGDIPMLNN